MSNASPVIHAARSDLVPMPPPLMRSILAEDWEAAGRLLGAGYPPEWRSGHWDWLGDRPDRADDDPSLVAWYPRVMVLRRQPPAVVGEAGFHGPPDPDGRVELGYMVLPAYRRQGFAEEAVQGLIAWAADEHRITRFRASIAPGNVASLGLVRKLGFVEVGTCRHEQLGEQLIFHLG